MIVKIGLSSLPLNYFRYPLRRLNALVLCWYFKIQNSFLFFVFVFCYRITIFTFFGVWFCFLWFILKSVDCSAFQISLVSKIYHRLSFLSETLSQNFFFHPYYYGWLLFIDNLSIVDFCISNENVNIRFRFWGYNIYYSIYHGEEPNCCISDNIPNQKVRNVTALIITTVESVILNLTSQKEASWHSK